MTKTQTVGVLALQGAFAEHCRHLEKAAVKLQKDVEVIEVRTPAELERCEGLVIPGGESTAISLVAQRSAGMLEALQKFVTVDKKPTWGTCAGLILISSGIYDHKTEKQTLAGTPEVDAHGNKVADQTVSALFGGLDVVVSRNYFGRQLGSFIAPLKLSNFGASSTITDKDAVFDAVFIRAPVVFKTLSDEVKVLAEVEDPSDPAKKLIVAVEQGHMMGTSFHPELSDDTRIHEIWLSKFL